MGLLGSRTLAPNIRVLVVGSRRVGAVRFGAKDVLRYLLALLQSADVLDMDGNVYRLVLNGIESIGGGRLGRN